jgi:4-hydroxybenzoate polyprenyltransferase
MKTEGRGRAGGGDDGVRAAAARRRRRRLAAAFAVFAVAFGARYLALQDARLEYGKVQWAVTAGYKRVARLLEEGGVAALFDRTSPLADPDTLGHPPGYPVLLAAVSRTLGESDAAAQLTQIACDALACVLLLLIVAELLPKNFAAAAVAGALSALSPQFTWNSVMLLPDTLAVLPVLAAVYCLARAGRGRTDVTGPALRTGGDATDGRSDRALADQMNESATPERPDARASRPRVSDRAKGRRVLSLMFACGALVGVSCWLRANALLLAPFLAALVVPLLFPRARRLRPAVALLAGAAVVVGTLTLRNAVAFGRFIPVSLGAGQTFLEGIADYDESGRFGIPRTDYRIQRQEWEASGVAHHRETLFGPDGVERDRARLRRGFAVVRSHPVWFAGVMLRRALSMLRLERSPIVSAEPPVTNSLEAADGAPAAWAASPAELHAAGAPRSQRAKISLTPDTRALRVEGDETKYGEQFASASFKLEEGTDYLLTVPVKVERGRARVGVRDTRGRLRASTLVEASETATAGEQPFTDVRLPFAAAGFDAARIAIENAGSHPTAQIGAASLRALGPSSHTWTRGPRTVLRLAQRFFVTAVVLPLALAGLFLLARRRARPALAVLLAVPAYYLCVQSAVHTEPRYVLAVYHFLFALAAVALAALASTLRRKVGRAESAAA